MELETIILSTILQSQKDKYNVIFEMWQLIQKGMQWTSWDLVIILAHVYTLMKVLVLWSFCFYLLNIMVSAKLSL